jgi:CheY-like chemotaxis protein
MTQSNRTILIADDDPDDVLLIQLALKKMGMTNPVQVVNDGHEAFAYLHGEGEYKDRDRYPLPFIVILDWKLLLITGLEILLAVRSQAVLKKLCIVVFTSSLNPRDRKDAFDAGADLFIEKPIGDFLSAMQEIVEFAKQC